MIKFYHSVYFEYANVHGSLESTTMSSDNFKQFNEPC